MKLRGPIFKVNIADRRVDPILKNYLKYQLDLELKNLKKDFQLKQVTHLRSNTLEDLGIEISEQEKQEYK